MTECKCWRKETKSLGKARMAPKAQSLLFFFFLSEYYKKKKHHSEIRKTKEQIENFTSKTLTNFGAKNLETYKKK